MGWFIFGLVIGVMAGFVLAAFFAALCVLGKEVHKTKRKG